ncbi:hypothetical protein GCM10010279_50230 [Streptomyces mutabilis]|nr:hypothetical protein GCM10010279_50230 [Streptomyces mutabilis]
MRAACLNVCLYEERRPIADRSPTVAPPPGGPMHLSDLSAELIGGGATLVGLGILTLASIRSIGRRRSSAGG